VIIFKHVSIHTYCMKLALSGWLKKRIGQRKSIMQV
jgi:hypothetical protein